MVDPQEKETRFPTRNSLTIFHEILKRINSSLKAD
jgi:hypothetical protein